MKHKKVTYNCKQNDAVLQFHLQDNKVSEIWVKIKGETSYTIVGFNDLQKGIEKVNSQIF